MPIFIFCTLVTLALHPLISFPNFSLLAQPFQHFCLQHTPSSEFSELYSAIICGKDLQNPTYNRIFRDTGLIHILVVSGSHLIMLHRFIHPLPFRYSLLFIYSLLAGAQPPIVRALIQLFLFEFQRKYELQWNSILLVFLSGLVSWSLQPQWIGSLSFQLSWACSLVLCLTEGQSFVFKLFAIYLITGLFLSQILWPHPISILTNALLAPLMGAALFPLSAICFFLDSFTPLVDLVWKFFITLCHGLHSEFVIVTGMPISNLHMWVLLWIMNLGSHARSRFQNCFR